MSDSGTGSHAHIKNASGFLYTKPRHAAFMRLVLHLFFCPVKSTRIHLRAVKRNHDFVVWAKTICHTWPPLLLNMRGQSDDSLPVQLVQQHILILLSKLMIQTERRSLAPAFTPFFHVTRAIGVKWTRSSSYPVIYFSFPVWQVTLFCPQRPGNC